MAGSTLDPDNIPARRGGKTAKGHDVKSLGPGDSSDSGSDMAGSGEMDDTSDAGNQERGVDRIVGEGEAGLGGGLDQAEEARLGKTDEQIERERKSPKGR